MRTRSKPPKQKLPAVTRMATNFLRTGMWEIKARQVSKGPVKRIYRYGSGESAGVVVVYGNFLTQQDRDAWYLIEHLDNLNGRNGVRGHVTDLLEAKGVKDKYSRTSINAVWDSIERLLDVHIRIRPLSRGASLSAGFRLLDGEIDTAGNIDLKIGRYRDFVEKHGLYEIRIPLQEHFALHSGIGRNLKDFLRTQANIYSKRGYAIGLTKLCRYIGYDTTKMAPSQIRQRITPALKELKQRGIITKYVFNKGKQDTLITFWKSKNTEELTMKDNEPLIELLQTHVPEAQDTNELRAALNKLKTHLEHKHGITTWDGIVREYALFLSQHASYWDVKLLYPNNSFYKQWVWEYKHNFAENFIEYGERWYLGKDGEYKNKAGELLPE